MLLCVTCDLQLEAFIFVHAQIMRNSDQSWSSKSRYKSKRLNAHRSQAVTQALIVGGRESCGSCSPYIFWGNGKYVDLLSIFSQDHPRLAAALLSLLLVALLKGSGTLVISTNIVGLLDLVESDDPVLGSECFFQRGKLCVLARDL